MTNLRNLNFPFHSKSKVQIHIQAERKREGKNINHGIWLDLTPNSQNYNYKKYMVNNDNN